MDREIRTAENTWNQAPLKNIEGDLGAGVGQPLNRQALQTRNTTPDISVFRKWKTWTGSSLARSWPLV